MTGTGARWCDALLVLPKLRCMAYVYGTANPLHSTLPCLTRSCIVYWMVGFAADACERNSTGHLHRLQRGRGPRAAGAGAPCVLRRVHLPPLPPHPPCSQVLLVHVHLRRHPGPVHRLRHAGECTRMGPAAAAAAACTPLHNAVCTQLHLPPAPPLMCPALPLVSRACAVHQHHAREGPGRPVQLLLLRLLEPVLRLPHPPVRHPWLVDLVLLVRGQGAGGWHAAV